MATAPATTPATPPPAPEPDPAADLLILLATAHLRGDRKYDEGIRADLMKIIDKMSPENAAEAKARLE